MSEVETEQTSVAVDHGQSLDAILGSGAPEVAAPSEPPSQEPDTVRDDEPQVSLLALHRERERRQKMDARVRELEDELQKYNEQKWGLEQQEGSAPPDAARQKEWEQRAFAYNQGYAKFVADHGKAMVEAVDAAIGKLSPQQQAHAITLAAEGEGGVERVHAYVEQLGLLEPDFKPKPLGDVLSGKKDDASKPASPEIPNLDARERAIMAAERSTAFNASLTEFVSVFGKAQYDQLDAASMALANSGHPAAQTFIQAVQASPAPVVAAAQMLHQLGMWAPEQASPASRSPQVMPSSFANTRSVNSRSGPAWAGPRPLTDIFKR